LAVHRPLLLDCSPLSPLLLRLSECILISSTFPPRHCFLQIVLGGYSPFLPLAFLLSSDCLSCTMSFLLAVALAYSWDFFCPLPPFTLAGCSRLLSCVSPSALLLSPCVTLVPLERSSAATAGSLEQIHLCPSFCLPHQWPRSALLFSGVPFRVRLMGSLAEFQPVIGRRCLLTCLKTAAFVPITGLFLLDPLFTRPYFAMPSLYPPTPHPSSFQAYSVSCGYLRLRGLSSLSPSYSLSFALFVPLLYTISLTPGCNSALLRTFIADRIAA